MSTQSDPSNNLEKSTSCHFEKRLLQETSYKMKSDSHLLSSQAKVIGYDLSVLEAARLVTYNILII